MKTYFISRALTDITILLISTHSWQRAHICVCRLRTITEMSQKPNMHVIGKFCHPCHTMHVFMSQVTAGEASSSPSILSYSGIVSISVSVLLQTAKWSSVIDKEAWVKSTVGGREWILGKERTTTLNQSIKKEEENCKLKL